jgi:hypothetical protein
MTESVAPSNMCPNFTLMVHCSQATACGSRYMGKRRARVTNLAAAQRTGPTQNHAIQQNHQQGLVCSVSASAVHEQWHMDGWRGQVQDVHCRCSRPIPQE